MSDDQSPPRSENKPTLATVGSTVTVVAGALGTVGITAGVITALLRNERALTIFAIVLVGVGVLAGVGAALFVERPLPGPQALVEGRKWRPEWGAVSSIALVSVGVFILVLLTASSLRTTNRPTITASVTRVDGNTSILEATVSAVGMTTDERYYIKVELFDPSDTEKVEPLFYTYAGANSDGKLDYKLKLTIPHRAAYPTLGVSAQLQTEGGPATNAQNCGLPVPTITPSASSAPSTAPSSPPTGLTSGSTIPLSVTSPPGPGITCAVVYLSAPTTSVKPS